MSWSSVLRLGALDNKLPFNKYTLHNGDLCLHRQEELKNGIMIKMMQE